MWRVFVVALSGCPFGECGGWAVVKRVHIMRRVDRTGSGVVCVQVGGSVPQFQRVVNVTLITVVAIVAFLKKPDLWRRATMPRPRGRTNVKKLKAAPICRLPLEKTEKSLSLWQKRPQNYFLW